MLCAFIPNLPQIQVEECNKLLLLMQPTEFKPAFKAGPESLELIIRPRKHNYLHHCNTNEGSDFMY